MAERVTVRFSSLICYLRLMKVEMRMATNELMSASPMKAFTSALKAKPAPKSYHEPMA